MSNDAEARRRARAHWPVKRYDLGNEPSDVITDRSPSELIAMVEQLTRDAWASAGLVFPSYSRADTPGRVVRRDR